MSESKDAAPEAAESEETAGAEAAKEEAESAAGADAEEAAPAEEETAEGEAEAEEGEAEEEPEPTPEERVAAAAAEVAELKDRLLRAMAETENLRQRAQREREDVAKYAIANFARDLLAVADNLRRAIGTVPEETRKADEALASLLEGVELTERELLAVFERHGVRKIDPMGEAFDHNWHQAVVEIEDPSSPAGTIVQVMQTGYAIAERLLRPAMVGVAKGKKDQGEDEHKVDTTA